MPRHHLVYDTGKSALAVFLPQLVFAEIQRGGFGDLRA